MKTLVIDNYDSFTFNLVHYIFNITGEKPDVVRNDKIYFNEIGNYDNIILSPGPGLPSEAGFLIETIKKYYSTKNILGICLGHQAIAEALGGSLKKLENVYHGVSTSVRVKKEDNLFVNVPPLFNAGRYHSWVVDKLPSELEITAVDEEGNIMAFSHKKYNVKGLQFHPESVMTEHGLLIMRNWLNLRI
jgi:anthranilate synthase component II